jgi:ubiquinone/menaquinone biosynthesis C-methylase UbiE
LVWTIPHNYSHLEAWVYDRLIAGHMLDLHTFILAQSHLEAVLGLPQVRGVLDVGCGGGQFAIWLKVRYPHLHLTGIDSSEDQIMRARKRTKRGGYDIRFETADAQALPFPDAHFDVVCSFGSAKHWSDPLQGFSECWRVLKPGGELLVADATSDATLAQARNFYAISHFPPLLEKPVSAILYRLMFRTARSMAYYQDIAEGLHMPPETVQQMPSLPVFLFRTQKP